MPLRTQHLRQRQSIHAGQIEIEQHRIEPARGDLGERGQSVTGMHHGVALCL